MVIIKRISQVAVCNPILYAFLIDNYILHVLHSSLYKQTFPEANYSLVYNLLQSHTSYCSQFRLHRRKLKRSKKIHCKNMKETPKIHICNNLYCFVKFVVIVVGCSRRDFQIIHIYSCFSLIFSVLVYHKMEYVVI